MRAGIGSLALLALAAASAGAQQQQPPTPRPPKTIRVPADYRTVQQAIDSARRGDTVLVAPGRYVENISFKGKDIVLTSHFALGGDTSFISRTVLDGSRPANPDTASVVIMDHDLDSTAVLQGFTITGGTGTVWLDPKDKIYFREGGGVLVEFSSPVIRHNVIEHNEATLASAKSGVPVRSAGGGGIRAGFAEPTIEHNVIRGNRGRYGAGVVLFYAAATVRNNLVAGNTGGEDFGGSGLWVVGPYSRRLPNVVEHNTVVRNVSTAPDSANPRAMKGTGGGMLFAGSVNVIRNNIVWGNVQKRGGQVGFAPGQQPPMTHNLVQGGGVAGAGNIDADPLFADTVSYRLSPRSPALGAGETRAELGAYGGARAEGGKRVSRSR